MKKIAAFLFTNYYLLFTKIASAQGLVPCSGPDCNLCKLLELVKNLITLMLQWGIALAGLFFAWGAILILTAGGSQEKASQGRKVITTAAIGVLIAFTSFMILGTLIQVITGSPSKLPWDQIQCTF